MGKPDSASVYPNVIRCDVPNDADGQRLDRYLAEAVKEESRSRLKALIEEGAVTLEVAGPNQPLDGSGIALTSPAKKVRSGDVIRIDVPPTVSAQPEPQDIPLNIVYEDAHLLVVDKPAGLVAHPAPGNPDQTLVNAVLGHLGRTGGLASIGGVERPGIVHRLDKDTSGLMVVAKSDAAHRGLVEQFQARTIERAYVAMVWGEPNPRSGEIVRAIGRDPRNRKRMAVVERGGKHAVTRYKVIQSFHGAISFIDCKLGSGRTHQIRVHMTHIGHPIVGDPVYGRNRKVKNNISIPVQNGQLLHARLLGFCHPVTHKLLTFDSNKHYKINELREILTS